MKNIYDIYFVSKLVDLVSPMVESSGKMELKQSLARVRDILEEEDNRSIVEELDRIKSHSDKELLDSWWSNYSVVDIFGYSGRRILSELRLVENELLERDLEDKMNELIKKGTAMLGPEEEQSFTEKIQEWSDEKLIDELEFYRPYSGDVPRFAHYVKLFEHEIDQRGLQ
jgi:hypothetical protein